ncbi:MAG: nicotinate-nucleotide adenylyltransferase [Chloroflexia bacterium]
MTRPFIISGELPGIPLRLGVVGGSFDPIHIGHLIMASAAREALNLDLLLFVPTAIQPLKQDRPASAPEHRVAMVELAIEENPYFSLSRVDVDRPGPSYTVDTLSLLRQEYPQAAFWFILGADALHSFPRWRDPEGILAQARLAIVRRPGVAVDVTALSQSLPQLQDAIDWVDAPLIDISSTDLRRRAAEGLSLKYRVSDPVHEYIDANKLYT